MGNDLHRARKVAEQFGAEAEANRGTSWSKDDRSDIASYYGADDWKDIPLEDQAQLLVSYRFGEKRERAKYLSDSLFLEVTKDWTPADWEGTSHEQVKSKIEEFMDEGNIKWSFEETVWAFEEWMGW